jgi:glycosyltransferase involved in cell wall biosynthesis
VGFPDRRVILVLGRIAYQKAQDLLVPAWEKEPIPDVDLVLVGPGDGDRLRSLAPKEWGRTVHHAGESTDVREWLWAADVLAVPSRYETVSLVAAEALATGLPVVATRFNGAVETITAGPLPAAGEVVAPGDMAGLLRACARRVDGRRRDDDDERAHARRRAELLFRPQNVYERLQSSYSDAISSYGLTRV